MLLGGKYLSTINYTSKPLLRQTSADVSKQRTENSNPIPNSCIPSPVSESRSLGVSESRSLGVSESPVSTRKLILHDYLLSAKRENNVPPPEKARVSSLFFEGFSSLQLSVSIPNSRNRAASCSARCLAAEASCLAAEASCLAAINSSSARGINSPSSVNQRNHSRSIPR